MSVVATGKVPAGPEAAQPLLDFIQTITVEQEKHTVFLRLPHPQKPEEFIASLGTALKELKTAIEQAQQQGKKQQQWNSMKQLLLAFHNYHDVYSSFSNYNGGPTVAEENLGLSWRVHLLPFVGESALYERFNLNEAWDSDQNKPLVKDIPKTFRVEGFEAVGHTSTHVFIGDDTPFNDETDGPPIRKFTDRTSNTRLLIKAGS